MSLKHAILGFLSFKPMTGYDLKKVFDRSVRHFWPANQSQIYRTLAELSEEGCVKMEVVEREERLDMKIYQITGAGRDELHRWLTTPLPKQDYREAFLIQIYFGGKLKDQEMIPLLKREIQALEETQAQFKAKYSMYLNKMEQPDSQRDLFFSMLPLEYGIANNQSALNWLRTTLKRLESGDYSPLSLENLSG
jgi:PadR family transcriptional regulator, regulatory protein AphA